MKSILFAIATLATTAFAGSGYDNPSKEFMLLLHSGNATIDGTVLGACHAGAGIDSPCLTNVKLHDPAASRVTFAHNVTSSSNPVAIDNPGVLAYNWASSNLKISSAMSMSEETTSNIGQLSFHPGQTPYVLVSFDADGAMYIPSTMDDTVSPPKVLDGNAKLKVESWYTCLTYYGTYLRVTLVWKIGVTGEPQNPTCQKVEVQRVFVGQEAQASAMWKQGHA